MSRTLNPSMYHTPERILVVDDEEPIREIVSSMLSAGGKYACLQASFRRRSPGPTRVRVKQFALMLSDLMMAGMDGIALLERAKERTPDMPVIMVTAVHDISVALAAIRNGAYDYLLKPFEREQLLATVRRAHGKSPAEDRKPRLPDKSGKPGPSPHPATAATPCAIWSARTTSRSKLWAMRSISRMLKRKVTPSA